MVTHQIVGAVNTGGKKRADELDYDPKDKKVYIANSDDGIVTAIDMTTFKIIKKFDNLGDALEQPRYDAADGMMYVTASGTDFILQFDPVKDELVKKIPTPAKCRPSGIWMNPKSNIGVVNCAPHPLVWDFNIQKMLSSLDQTGRADEIFYDARTDLYILGEQGWDHGPHVGIVGGTPIKFITNVPAALGCHNAGFDNTNIVVYTMGQDALLSFPLPAKALAKS
jgi:YVTN family beta-propeller protein